MSAGIRPAQAIDAPGIRETHAAAFPTRAEADLVERLEAEGDAIVSVVAEDQGEVVGHVLLSRMQVAGGGRGFRAVGLGPVGVRPGFQGRGVGAQLIEGALAIAKATGEELAFVLGEPDYYQRFGFSAETAAPFGSPYAGRYFMALALRPDVALPDAGVAAYARAFADLPE